MHDDSLKPRLIVGTKSAMWIVAAELIVFSLLGWYGYTNHGSAGITAASVAAAVCLLPAVIAIFAVAYTAGTANAISGILASMIARTAVPFFAIILSTVALKPLVEVGLLGMVLVNYFVVLIVESALAIHLVQVFTPKPIKQ